MAWERVASPVFSSERLPQWAKFPIQSREAPSGFLSSLRAQMEMDEGLHGDQAALNGSLKNKPADADACRRVSRPYPDLVAHLDAPGVVVAFSDRAAPAIDEADLVGISEPCRPRHAHGVSP